MSVSELFNLSMPMAALLASLIGASATITAALLNLRIAWRKELQARAEHKPVSKKAKRGPISSIVILLIASAIGGFALSHYLASEGRKSSDVLEAELRRRIDQLTLSTQRLEQVGLFGKEDLLRQLRREEALRQGREGVVTTIGVARCVAAASDTAGMPLPCDEPQALHLQLCAEVPAAATVAAVDLYARGGEVRPWSESLVAAGSDFGGGRYAMKPVERLLNDSRKEVCQGLSAWRSDSALQARMVVRYAPNLASEGALHAEMARP